MDTVDSHQEFACEQKLPFTLLSDHRGLVANRYGSLNDFGVLKLAKRNTFLVDPGGKIARVYLGVNPAANAADVVADLRKLQS